MSDYQKARRHLARRDPIMKTLIAAVGPCTLVPNSDHFLALAGSIIAQQISTKAAASIRAKLTTNLGKAGLTPAAIVEAPEELLQASGLSTSKRKALRDLARRVHSGQLPFHDIHECSDEEVIARLVPVFGIGRWTAQMFLMFSLGRPDVLPVADLGLRTGVKQHYELAELPSPECLEEIALSWKPYRSIGTWYVWKSLGPVPESK